MASPSIRTRVDAADVEADEEAMRAREAAAGDGADDAKAVGADAGPGPAPESAGGAAGTVPLAERLAALRAAELARTDRLVPPSPQAEPVLEVKGLSIAFPAQHGDVDIVDNAHNTTITITIVLYSRVRNAIAPSLMCPAISFILSSPSFTFLIQFASMNATKSARTDATIGK